MNEREREERDERRADARAWAEAEQQPPGKASNYIYHCTKLAKFGIKVVLYLRESTRSQKHHLDDQEAWCRRELERMGVTDVIVFPEVASGVGFADRPVFHAAIAAAKQHGVILVALGNA